MRARDSHSSLIRLCFQKKTKDCSLIYAPSVRFQNKRQSMRQSRNTGPNIPNPPMGMASSLSMSTSPTGNPSSSSLAPMHSLYHASTGSVLSGAAGLHSHHTQHQHPHHSNSHSHSHPPLSLGNLASLVGTSASSSTNSGSSTNQAGSGGGGAGGYHHSHHHMPHHHHHHPSLPHDRPYLLSPTSPSTSPNLGANNPSGTGLGGTGLAPSGTTSPLPRRRDSPLSSSR